VCARLLSNVHRTARVCVTSCDVGRRSQMRHIAAITIQCHVRKFLAKKEFSRRKYPRLVLW
jgi:hypothetical protein